MSIDELLKSNIDIRITNGNKWLIYDGKEYIVYKHERYKKHSKILYSGNNINDAIYILIEID